MIEMANNPSCTVRVIVKMTPDQYDELIRHVREIGSTMSAFFRDSAARAMKENWRIISTGPRLLEGFIATDITSGSVPQCPLRNSSTHSFLRLQRCHESP
jgi:hypothetical protein